MPQAAHRTWLSCVGDANDPLAWSSTPFHVLEEGRRQGVIDAGVALQPELPWVGRWRNLWNLKQLLTARPVGGFQYSDTFLERLWRQTGQSFAGCDVINHFQMFPASMRRDPSIRKWFYIDGTLRQLVEYYGDRLRGRWYQEVLRRETEGYHAAAGVFTMSQFAANSLIADYGLEASKVHVAVPGANITTAQYEQFEPEFLSILGKRVEDLQEGRRPPRLLFVGRYAVRKGADRLLRALRIARASGLKMTLRIIGLKPDDVEPELRLDDGVEWLGLVSKRTEMTRLLRLIAECDIGCLLSRAEMAGISIRESHVFGQPVIGPDTGGSPDLMFPGICWKVAPADSDEMIADLLLRIEQDPAELQRRIAACAAARRDALWCPAIAKIGQVMQAAR